MEFLYLFLIILACIGICVFIVSLENSHMASKGINVFANALTHIGGIPHLKEGTYSYVGVFEEQLTVNKTHFIPLSRVQRLQFLSETQLIEKQKSVLKRAVVGGLLLGPVAAIVGGISGIGTKHKKELQHFLSIDFVDKEGKEMTAMFLVHKVEIARAQRLASEVNRMVGYQTVEVPSAQQPYDI